MDFTRSSPWARTRPWSSPALPGCRTGRGPPCIPRSGGRRRLPGRDLTRSSGPCYTILAGSGALSVISPFVQIHLSTSFTGTRPGHPSRYRGRAPHPGRRGAAARGVATPPCAAFVEAPGRSARSLSPISTRGVAAGRVMASLRPVPLHGHTP